MKNDKRKIAVIDDEKDLCHLIEGILLGTEKYHVYTAYDGESGFKLCLNEIPDLIFMDYVMPKMKGDELLHFLNSNAITESIPIVVISGLDDSAFSKEMKGWEEYQDEDNNEVAWRVPPVEMASKFCLRAYLPKPFSKKALIAVAEYALRPEQDK